MWTQDESGRVKTPLEPLVLAATLAQRRADEEVELSVTVEEYFPRLAARLGAPGWTGTLYAKGQSPLHAAVSRRYFELLVSRAGM